MNNTAKGPFRAVRLISLESDVSPFPRSTSQIRTPHGANIPINTYTHRRRETLWPRLGLLTHPGFFRLCTGQVISLFGTQVTTLALPTVAILTLHADPFSVGVLGGLQWLAYLFLGPIVGVMVDRFPKRRIMIIANLGRLVALGSIPVVFALGTRTMYQLYIVAAVVSVFGVFFEVSYRAYLPDLVDRTDLAEGNMKLTLGAAAARVGGPALGSLLIQLVGAAFAIVADALSYLASVLFLSSIQHQKKEVVSPPRSHMKGVFKEMSEGMVLVFHTPILRTLTLVNAAQNFGVAMIEAILLIFAYQNLHLSPGMAGIAIAAGNIGFVLGGLLALPAARTIGLGLTFSVSFLVGALSCLILPLGLLGMPILVLVLRYLLFGIHIPTWDINQFSLRQAITPDTFQGRIDATIRTFSFGGLGLGAFFGGWLSTQIGIVPTILLGGTIFLFGSLPMLTKPIRTLKNLPGVEQHRM